MGAINAIRQLGQRLKNESEQALNNLSRQFTATRLGAKLVPGMQGLPPKRASSRNGDADTKRNTKPLSIYVPPSSTTSTSPLSGNTCVGSTSSIGSPATTLYAKTPVHDTFDLIQESAKPSVKQDGSQNASQTGSYDDIYNLIENYTPDRSNNDPDNGLCDLIDHYRADEKSLQKPDETPLPSTSLNLISITPKTTDYEQKCTIKEEYNGKFTFIIEETEEIGAPHNNNGFYDGIENFPVQSTDKSSNMKKKGDFYLSLKNTLGIANASRTKTSDGRRLVLKEKENNSWLPEFKDSGAVTPKEDEITKKTLVNFFEENISISNKHDIQFLDAAISTCALTPENILRTIDHIKDKNYPQKTVFNSQKNGEFSTDITIKPYSYKAYIKAGFFVEGTKIHPYYEYNSKEYI